MTIIIEVKGLDRLREKLNQTLSDEAIRDKLALLLGEIEIIDGTLVHYGYGETAQAAEDYLMFVRLALIEPNG